MRTQIDFTLKPRKLVFLLLVVAQLAVLTPTRAGILQTIGDFLSLGANTVREIQEAILLAGDETRVILEQLEGELTSMLETLEQTYQDNLNVTLDSLDAATRAKLLEIETIMGRVNEQLQEDIRLISDEAKAVIRDAGLEIRRTTAELEESLQNVIIVGGETVLFVLDRAVSNAIIIFSLVLLGVGVLIFVFLLFTRRLPANQTARVFSFVLMVGYIALFGALVLVPPVRVFVMTTTGIGLQQRLETITAQPRILAILPDTVLLGQTSEIEVWGSKLRVDGEPPQAKIADQVVTLNAASDDKLALNVANLTGSSGSTNLVLEYPERDPLTEVIRLVQPTPVPDPADLTITNLVITPSSPVQRANAQASLTIRNQGGVEARNFIVRWRPLATHPGLTQTVARLGAGQSTTLTFNHAYIDVGRFDSVATVDTINNVAESNEGNNDRSRSVTVQQAPPRRARVRVDFSRITIHDDAETGAGELILNFNVNGQTARFPNTGTRSMNAGSEINIGRVFDLTLEEGQDLVVFVNGIEEDGGLTGGDDDMGFVRRTYTSSQQWSRGNHSERSNCPDGCYTIHYNIEVTFLN